MKSLLKHGNLNEMAFRSVQQADGSVVTIPTQHHAEASLITHGPKPTKSGSTLPDLEIHLADGSKVNAEVKSGTNVDLAQMTVNMDPDSEEQVTFSGPSARKAEAGLKANDVTKRIMNHIGKRVGGDAAAHHRAANELSSQHYASLTDKHKQYTDRNLETARAAHLASNPNDQAFQEFNQKNALNAAKQESIKQINRDHPEQAQYVHTSSKEIQPLTGMASSMAHLTGRFGTGLGKTEPRKKMDNRMVHDFLHNYEDPIQKHIHQKTGEIAVFPVSNEHRKHTDQMGLKGQVSLEDIVNHPEERRSSLGVMSRLRRKEKRGNLSVTGDSSSFVDAVKRRGGTVFANADEYKAHATEHGYQVRSGQFPNDPPETVNEETSVLSEVVSGLYAGIAMSAMEKLRGIGGDEDKKAKPTEPTEPTKPTDPTAAPASLADEDLTPEQRQRREKGQKDAQDAMDRGETNVQTDVETGDAIVKSDPFRNKDVSFEDQFGFPETPSEPASTAPAGPAGGHQQMPDNSGDTTVSDEEKEKSKTGGGTTISPGGANESMFHVASVLREDDEDENYSYDEINQDKDPDAAGGPYSEDDIKVTKDPRDSAPGMDPVADPPTQQAKQVTTGMAYKAPAAAGTMQTMLPGGEHDAIQKQYPDLIENLLGCGSDMKGGFLADPKDKKKAMAAMALMASLDKKLKEDKKTRLKKILNTTKPPAIPGSEGY